MKLLALPTAPLYEGAVAQWIADFAAARGMRVKRDPYGNLLVHYRRGRRPSRPVVFAAHMDHPGFGADRMLGPKTLLAEWRGGVPVELFAGAKVRFNSAGRWIKGEVIRVETDVPRGTPREARIRVERPVEPGSAGMWDFGEPRVRGGLLYARGHDDVAGVAAIVSALDEAHRRRLDGEFYALFTRCEEAGFIGAIAACRDKAIPARAAIVALETSRELPDARLGKGVIVRVGDRASIFTPWVSAALAEAATTLEQSVKGFAFQRRLMYGGTCESTVYADYGYDAGGLCLPLRNYHNVNWDKMTLAPECIDLADYENLVRLLVHVARHGLAQPAPGAGPKRWGRWFQGYTVRASETVFWPGRRR
jgi:endoglucanase